MRRGIFMMLGFVQALWAPSALARPKPSSPEPEKPPVAVNLSLSEHGPDAQWEISVRNDSDRAIRFEDDLRLLSLEVTIPGQEKTKTCRLPADVLPRDADPGEKKELKPGVTLAHPFDPRFYCYTAGKQETLVPGAQVTAHFGFPSKTKTRFVKGKRVEEKLPDKAPFTFEPVERGDLGPLKNATSNPVVLDARYAAWTDEGEKKQDEDEPSTDPVLELVRGSDAPTERQVSATVRLRNPSDRRVTVYLRRALLTFEVAGPHGTTTCEPGDETRNPDRGAFTRLGPHGSISLVTRLVEICERGTFAESGLYVVNAKLDATATGADFGFDAFTGKLATEKPVTVRVRKALRLIPILRGRTPGAPGAPPIPGQVPPLPAPPLPVPATPPPMPPPVPPAPPS